MNTHADSENPANTPRYTPCVKSYDRTAKLVIFRENFPALPALATETGDPIIEVTTTTKSTTNKIQVDFHWRGILRAYTGMNVNGFTCVK